MSLAALDIVFFADLNKRSRAFEALSSCIYPWSLPMVPPCARSLIENISRPFSSLIENQPIQTPLSRSYSILSNSKAIRRSFQGGDSTILNIVKNIKTKIKNHINRASNCLRFSKGKTGSLAILTKDFAQPLAGGKEHENDKGVRGRSS